MAGAVLVIDAARVGTRGRRWDLVALVAFFVVGALLGRSAMQAQARAGRPPAFYQNWLAPAVFDACGFGYVEVADDRVTPALADFLSVKTDRISCEDLPREAPRQPANWYARMHRYLGATLTLMWRVRGIRWSALAPVFEGLCGLVAALIYALFRLGLNRWWSIAGTAAIATSGLNLFYLYKLRDYSKAPFLLASLLICGVLVSAPVSRRRLLTLSALFGGVIGIGLGFRTDVIVAVPLFLLVLGFFLPAPRPAWRVRGAALALFVAVFIATGWPLLRAYSHGSNAAHVTLLGFIEPFAGTLGLESADYTLGVVYGDRPVEAAVRDYDRLTNGGPGWAAMTTPRYDRLCSRFLVALARTLPADVLVHAYAAVIRVLDSPFDRPGRNDCESLRPSLAGTACHVRNTVLPPLRFVGPLAVALLIVGAVAVQPRLGGFLIAVVTVFVGSTTLQFDPRHTFYLEFVPLWAIACLAQRAGTVRSALGQWRDGVWRTAAVVTVLLVVPTIALIGARVYQQRALTALFTRYLAADADPLPVAQAQATAVLPLDNLLPPLDPHTPDVLAIRSALMRVEVGGPACAGRTSWIMFRYELPFNGRIVPQGAVLRWSVPASGAPVRIVAPVYRMLLALPSSDVPIGELHLLDLEMPDADKGCLLSLAAIRRPEEFPIRLMTVLGPDWQAQRQYQTLSSDGAQNTPGLP